MGKLIYTFVPSPAMYVMVVERSAVEMGFSGGDGGRGSAGGGSNGGRSDDLSF